MNKIDAVYIACHRHDAHYARACVASIRQWYPDLPIVLVKDLMFGDFGTRDFESAWGVRIFRGSAKRFGWGFSKLEVLIERDYRRVLILDADTLFVGPLIGELERVEEDFVVQMETPTEAFVATHAFSLERLAEVDPAFVFPGYTFNTGQLVVRTGVFGRDDFDPFVRWEEPRRLAHPDVFRMGEQGLLNYLLQKKAATGEIALRRIPMMEIPGTPRARSVRIEELHPGGPHRFVIHWCGMKGETFRGTLRGDLLMHFEKRYYKGVPSGCALRWLRAAARGLERNLRRVTGKIRARSVCTS
jgi:hypothetical protein